MRTRHTVEEALHAVEDRAAMVRFLASAIREVHDAPEPAFFMGLADLLGEMETTVCAVRHALDVDALGRPIGGRS